MLPGLLCHSFMFSSQNEQQMSLPTQKNINREGHTQRASEQSPECLPSPFSIVPFVSRLGQSPLPFQFKAYEGLQSAGILLTELLFFS